MEQKPEALRLAYRLAAHQLASIKADVLMHEIEAELRRLHAENESLREQNTLVDQACARLEAENEALRKDAERYRWLRERATVSHSQIAIPDRVIYPTTWHFVTGGSDVDMDAAIDAAMKEKP